MRYVDSNFLMLKYLLSNSDTHTHPAEIASIYGNTDVSSLSPSWVYKPLVVRVTISLFLMFQVQFGKDASPLTGPRREEIAFSTLLSLGLII